MSGEEDAAAVKTLLVCSDVTLGFSVPQVALMARSLQQLLGCHVVIVEPDMKKRLELLDVPGCEVRRVATRMPPHHPIFRVEYVRAAREIYEELRPDYLLILNAAVIPPLLLSSHKPECAIYYMLESSDHQVNAGGRLYYDMNRMVASSIDLVVVPERRRYEIDAARLGWNNLPVVEVLNISAAPCPRRERPEDCRFLFAGTLNRASGFDWLCDPRLADFNIDVAGPLDSSEARELLGQFLAPRGSGERRYLGLLPHADLLGRLHDYAYRIVLWKPEDVNTLFASPNKLFESIGYMVPPVALPNPQVLDVVRRHRCGIVAQDFGLDAFCHAMSDAALIFPTATYDRLTAGCEAAGRAELNWDAQFGKVARALQALGLASADGLRRGPDHDGRGLPADL